MSAMNVIKERVLDVVYPTREKNGVRTYTTGQLRRHMNKKLRAERRAQPPKWQLIPEKLLSHAEVSATTGYSSPYVTAKLNDQLSVVRDRAELFLTSGVLGLIVGFLGGGIVFPISLNVMGDPGSTILNSVGQSCFGWGSGGSGLLLGLGGGLAVVRRARVKIRQLAPMLEGEKTALRAWLRERYALKVDDTEISRLIEVVQGRWSPKNVVFKDANANTLRMELRDDAWFVAEHVLEPEQEFRPEGTVAAAGIPALSAAPAIEDLLTGEIAVLHAGVLDLLSRLEVNAALPPEQRHVCARVREDLAGALGLVRRMHALGEPLPEQHRQVTAIFAAMMDELRGVVAAQQADITRELSVQQAYLSARRSLTPVSSNRHSALSLAETPATGELSEAADVR